MGNQQFLGSEDMGFSPAIVNALRNNRTQQVLDRLHTSARADKYKFMGFIQRFLWGTLQGKSAGEILTPEMAKDIYMPVSRTQGNFMYQTARAIGAKRIVEFGTSFGISTIYLAAAVKDNDGEIMIGTELEPSKYAQAIKNIAEAGLDGVTEVRFGDVLETLKETPQPLDMVFLDGWKELYMPVLEMLKPRLRIGSIVLADNIFTFKKSLRPYVEYMQLGNNGFESTTLRIGDGLEYSVCISE